MSLKSVFSRGGEIVSLINRLELSNFLVGASKTAAYRHALFDFEGKSTAVVMGNGGGKTTINNALIGMMSRNNALMGKTRALMALPGPGSVYSHIRIEFLMPDAESSYPSTLPGMTSALAGETWVFGICGYAGDNGALYYYYYPGVLEESSVIWLSSGDDPSAQDFRGCRKRAITLISNADFREKIKNIPGARMGRPIPRDEWLKAIQSHISPQQVEQHRHFQSAGGGDKSADLYKTSRVPQEPFHQTFFYEHIAPQLTMGSSLDLSEAVHIQGDEDARSDCFLDEKILDISLSIINTGIQARKKQKELEKQQNTIDLLDTLASIVEEISGTREKKKSLESEIASTAALMKHLVLDRPLPGIPVVALSGVDMVDSLVRDIVIVPAMKPPFMIRDRGLATLTGQEVKRVNELAQRCGINGAQSSQLIEIICDLEGSTPREKGKNTKYLPRLYSMDKALAMIERASIQFLCRGDRTPAESRELRDSLARSLAAAFDHFESCIDTSPFRRSLKSIHRQLHELSVTLDHLGEQKTRDEARKMDIESNLATFRSDQRCFNEMESSALFTPVELEHPGSCKANLKEERDRLQDDLSKSLSREALHRSVHAAYLTFLEKHPQDSPGEALARMEKEEGELKARRERLKGQIDSLEKTISEGARVISRLHQEIEGDKTELDKMASLHALHLKFLEKWPQETPDQVLGAISHGERALLKDMEELKKLLHSLKFERIALEKAISQKRREHGEAQKKLEAMADFHPSFERVVKSWPGEKIEGLEDRVRTGRASLEGRLKSLDREITRLEKIHGMEIRFREEISPLDPDIWMDGAAREREGLYNRLNTLKSLLESLGAEHAILLGKKAAPPEIFRKALERIPGEISFTPLHSFVTDHVPSKDHRGIYLCLFSSFLFAPVVDLPEHAGLLLELFGSRAPAGSSRDSAGKSQAGPSRDSAGKSQAGPSRDSAGKSQAGPFRDSAGKSPDRDSRPLPVPVFIGEELLEFINSHPAKDIRVCPKSRVVSHMFAGIATDTLGCILDPRAIELKREEVAARIQESTREIESVESRLRDIAPESHAMTLAHKARESRDSRAGEGLGAARREKEILLGEMSAFVEKYPDSCYHIFREAEQFDKRGGVELWKELGSRADFLGKELGKLRQDDAALADRAARTEEEHKRVKGLYYEYKNRHDRDKADILRLMEFHQSGGVEKWDRLMESVKSRTMELEEFEADRDRDMETRARLIKEKDDSEDGFTQRITSNLPLKQSLREMIVFMNGPDFNFMKDAASKIESLEKNLSIINRKLGFRLDEAQRFVDHLATSSSGEKERIDEINRQLRKNISEIGAVKEKIEALTERQRDLSIASPQYDRILCHIISHFNTPNISYKESLSHFNTPNISYNESLSHFNTPNISYNESLSHFNNPDMIYKEPRSVQAPELTPPHSNISCKGPRPCPVEFPRAIAQEIERIYSMDVSNPDHMVQEGSFSREKDFPGAVVPDENEMFAKVSVPDENEMFTKVSVPDENDIFAGVSDREQKESPAGMAGWNPGEGSMVADLDAVNDYLGSTGIGSFSDRIKAVDKKIESGTKLYGTTLEKGLSDPDIPLKIYEKEHLRETLDHPEFLMDIRKTYMEIYQREKENYERVAHTEETLRSGLADDLTRLTDKAHDNFIILKKILKSYTKSSGASFDVKVTIAGRDNIKEAIEGIIRAVKSKHELYIEGDGKVIEKSPSRLKRDDGEYYGDLRTLISRDCYRQIFINPEIRFIHPEIRNGSPTIYVNDGSISNGQRSALALLWVVALADFAVQRKNHEDRSRGVLQTGGRTSSFLLIDGLFSQLSDENLISLSMKSLPDTEGNFQIIGFIHSPTYVHQHDFKVFPVLIQAVQHQQMEGSRRIRWVSLEKHDSRENQILMKVTVDRQG
ncbi:MAG: hypothetical protein HQK66_06645 [Desulfamplus sp.]|nr:hypothetical protein [Desulfamplus sp.]